MDAQFDFFIFLFNIAIFLVPAGILISSIYKRATKGLAYVRSGYGGETVIQDTGMFVLPFLHRVIPVNMNTLRLEVAMTNESAVLTKDYLKIDLWINFYVRVLADEQEISRAAQTLGLRTLDTNELKAFLEGKLVNAIRTVVAEMTLQEIHQQRGKLVEKIKLAVQDDLQRNSLQLESVALDHIVQTAREFFYEENLLDASALTKLSEAIEIEEKRRSAIEQETRLEKKLKELDIEKQIIEMENKKNRLRLEQKREYKLFEAANALKISKDAAAKHAEEERAKLIAEQEIELAKQAQENTINLQINEQLKTQIEADLVRADAARVEEQIITARELEIANRKNQIEFSKEKLKDEHETAMITAVAGAKKAAAFEYAEADRITAQANADKLRLITKGRIDADELLTKVSKSRYQNGAEGIKILIDAFSNIGTSKLSQELHHDLMELLSELINKDNQLISTIETMATKTDKHNGNSKTVSSDYSGNSQQNIHFKADKLQMMLEDAHNSLVAETVNSMIEMDGNNPNEKMMQHS